MKTVRIRESLGAGWKSFKRRPWYLFGLSLAVLGMFVLALGDAVVTAVAYILYGGYLAMLIRHYKGEQVEFDDLFTIDNRWIYFTFLGLIKGLLILVGLVLFIVPGVYLAIRWMFAEFYVINEGMKPMEALRASSALTEGHRWKLFGFSLVVLLMHLAGLIVFVVGIVVAYTVALIATYKLYEDLKASKAPQSTQPAELKEVVV